MTTAQLHDSQACDALIQGDEAAVYADKADDDTKRRERLKALGIKVRILYEARRNKPLTTWQKYFNKTAAVVRAAVERPFALMKGPYRLARCRYLGLARCRYLGLARNDAHLQLFASAYNLKTAMVLVRRGARGGDVCPMIDEKDKMPWRRRICVILSEKNPRKDIQPSTQPSCKALIL